MAQLEFLNTAPSVILNPLAPYVPGILAAFARATEIVDGYLPMAGVRYVAYHLPRMWSPVGGHAWPKGTIYLSFNPAADPKYDIEKLFPIYLAHERVHEMQHRGHGFGYTLLGKTISEGQATIAEDEVARLMGLNDHPLSCEHHGQKWHPQALHPYMLEYQLQRFRERNDILLGYLTTHEEKGFDPYAVGHYIVSKYMKEQGIKSVLDTLPIPAREIARVALEV